MDEFYEVTIEDVFSSLTLYELDRIAESNDNINTLFTTSWPKYKHDFLLQVYFIRSTLQHKENALRLYSWIANNDSTTFCSMLPSIVFYGDWQDLFDLYSSSTLQSLPCSMILLYITKQILMDYATSSNVSTLINYLPRERSAKDRSIGWVFILTDQLKISRKKYRIMTNSIKQKPQSSRIIFRLVV